jgi:predicted MFS family arabinose efflux permease
MNSRCEGESTQGFVRIAAIIVIGVIGGWATVIMPGILGVLTERGIGPAQASVIGSSELVGMTVSLAVTALLIAKLDRKRLALGGIITLVAGQVLSVYANSYGLLLPIRFMTGLGEGVVVTAMTAAASSSPNSDRIFGLYLAVLLGGSSLFFVLLPHLSAIAGAKTVFGTLAGLTLLIGFMVPWFPNRSAPINANGIAAERPAATSGSRKWPGYLGLAATLVLLMGIGTVWPLMSQIAQSRGMEPRAANDVLASASFAGIVSGLFVSWYGARSGRRIPLMIGSAALSVTMAAILGSSQAVLFTILAISFMFWWIYSVTYYLGVLAALDRTGRLASFSFATQTFGMALGQALAASLVHDGDYRAPIVAGIASVAGALALVLAAIALSPGQPAEPAVLADRSTT